MWVHLFFLKIILVHKEHFVVSSSLGFPYVHYSDRHLISDYKTMF